MTKSDDYPLLESSGLYKAMKNAEEGLRKAASSYRKAIAELLVDFESWRWRDHVSDVYLATITKDVIFEPAIDRPKVITEWEHRLTHKIPPGYKDGRKDDAGTPP